MVSLDASSICLGLERIKECSGGASYLVLHVNFVVAEVVVCLGGGGMKKMMGGGWWGGVRKCRWDGTRVKEGFHM